MEQKYGTLNPMTGEYTFYTSQDAAIDGAVQLAFDLYLSHTHQQPFAKITVDDTGAETWESLNGNSMLSPAQLLERQQQMTKHMRSFTEAQQMPSTVLGG